MATKNAINTEYLASAASIKAGTNTLELMAPSPFNSYMQDLIFTGFYSWSGAGAYFDDTTLGDFELLRGGTGYIKGKLITFAGSQTVTGLTAGNTYYIYIDSAGILKKTSTFSSSLYEDYIILFECLRDSTPVTNNQVTVRENHPYAFQATVSSFLHDVVGPVIENNTNGANITLNGTQKIQINGVDYLADHGLQTEIPDSGGVGVVWNQYYTTAGGAWARYTQSDTFAGVYNNAGTPTALGANKFGIYTLYVSKESLNSSTPTYFAVLDNTQYNNLAGANLALSNKTMAQSSNELSLLEIAQLGHIIYSQASSSIVSVVIEKETLKSTRSTSGTNTASLVNTNVTNFNGWLSSADTNVQASLDTLDDSQRLTEETGASANLVVNKGVIANRGTLVTLTLPTTAEVGDTIEVAGKGAGLWKIAQNAGQTCHFGNSDTTTGVGGSLAATLQYDCIKLICITADTEFVVTHSVGNITVV
jgi:hypothetical protein